MPEANWRRRSRQSLHWKRLCPEVEAAPGESPAGVWEPPPPGPALCARHEGVHHHLVTRHHPGVVAPVLREVSPHHSDPLNAYCWVLFYYNFQETFTVKSTQILLFSPSCNTLWGAHYILITVSLLTAPEHPGVDVSVTLSHMIDCDCDQGDRCQSQSHLLPPDLSVSALGQGGNFFSKKAHKWTFWENRRKLLNK